MKDPLDDSRSKSDKERNRLMSDKEFEDFWKGIDLVNSKSNFPLSPSDSISSSNGFSFGLNKNVDERPLKKRPNKCPCESCKKSYDCGKCINCLDKKGLRTRKQKCIVKAKRCHLRNPVPDSQVPLL